MKKIFTLTLVFLAMLFGANAQYVYLLQENFDSGVLPTGWTSLDADGDGHNWDPTYLYNQSPTYAHTGAGMISSASYDSQSSSPLSPNNWLISPAVELTDNATLTFWICAQDNLYPSEHYGVYISTSGTDTSDFTLLFEETLDANSGAKEQSPWKQKTINLTEYTGQTVYIAFRHFNTYDMFWVNLDDVEITVLPTNPFITVSSANLLINAMVGGSGYAQTAVNGFNLASGITATTSAPFAVSDDGSSFNSSITLPLDGGTLYVEYSPTSAGLENGYVILSSAGANDDTIFITGKAFEAASLPYSSDFEDESENAQWQFVNNGVNQWVIGTAVNNTTDGESALYISNDGGVSNEYSTSSTSTSWAYRDIDFGQYAEYQLAFDFRGYGESASYDYLKIYIGAPVDDLPASGSTSGATPTGATLIGTLNGISNWTHVTGTLNSSFSGLKRLYLLWWNDSSVGTNPPAAIDNITITGSNCGRPGVPTFSDITAYTATFTFQPALEDDYAWEYALCTGTEQPDDVVPVSISETTVSITDLEPGTTYHVYVRTVCDNDEFSVWSNGVTFTTNPTCTSPTNLTVSQITGTSALVTWDAAPLGATGYTISYSVVSEDEEDWISETVTELQYMLTGLEPHTPYIVKVTSECDEGSAPAVLKNFTTHCLAGGEFQIGEGSETNSFLPSYSLYNYSYTQQIFLSNEMNGAGEYTSIAFHINTLNTPDRHIAIYLMNTSADAASWLNADSAQMVFNDNVTLTEGWNTFDFITPFNYDGTNLAVIVIDSTGEWHSSNNWTVHTTSTNLSSYVYQDSAPYSISSTPSGGYTTNKRNNVIFGGECDETVSCVAPNAFLSDISLESLTLNWVPGYTESAWEVEYCTDTANWIPLGIVTTSPYLIDNLDPNTLYTIRIRSICDGGEYSNWNTMQAQTTICDLSAQCAYTFNLTDSYGDGWNGGTLTVIQNGTTITTLGLSNGSSATETVNLCENMQTELIWNAGSFAGEAGFSLVTPYGEEIYAISGMSNYTTFTFLSNCTMPECPSPVKNSVTASDIDGHNATISFVDNNPEHNSWTIYYKAVNAPADEDWLTLVTDETTATLTDLTAETTYTVYVVTNCDTPDEVPDATYPIQFTTAVTCPAPTNITVTPGMTEAIVSWEGSADSYTVTCGEITITVSENTTTLTELNGSTNYTVSVIADCGDEGLSSAATASFLTASCELSDQCTFTFDLHDSYGDGWNGASISVMQNGVAIASLTIPSSQSSANYEVALCDNASIALVWNGGSYDGECSFTVADPFGETIYTSTSMSGVTGTFISFTSRCTPPECPSPVKNSVTASNIDGHNATISFEDNDPEHNSWTVYYRAANAEETEEWLTAVTNETSVVLTNLDPETTYDVYVITNCDTPEEEPDATNTIQFTTAVACPAPQNLTVSNSDLTSATITWFSNAESYTIEYGETGFTAGTGTVVTTVETTYEITGLTSSTSYTVIITADCGDDGTSSSSSVSFATACEAMAIPYTEDFESYTGSTYTDANGIAPVCWTTYSTNTTYGVPHIISSGSYHYVSSGTNSMIFTCGYAGSDAYAALPAFTENLNTLNLKFWRAMENTTYGTLTVGYVTNINDMAGTFVSVATIPSVSSSTGDTISVDFTGADIPANGNICFHWNYSTSYYSCCIDDIAVTSAGSGPGPVITNPTVTTNAASGATQTTATLNATISNPDNVAISAKGFEWKATMGGTYAPVTVTGDNFSYNLTNLTPNTSYTFKAFITYNGTTVYGDEKTFNTLPEDVQPCEVPTGLVASNITKESFTVTWDNHDGVSSWNVQYRPLNGQLSSAVTYTNHYDFTDLTAETVYQVQVQANCGDGNLSEWTGIYEVTTLVDGIENYLINRISLYPNPAKEYVDIRVDENVNVKGMEVYDVYGKLINTVNVIDNPTRISVSGLADGMYFVRVTTDQGVATKQFVKR